jgi:putative ABC transport system substrate-binding protein
VRRRDFITLLGGAAAAWPLVARAQQAALPLIGFVSGRAAEEAALPRLSFRQGLAENGIIDGQNATVEHHWLNGQYDQLPSLMADLIRRHVAVIATPGTAAGSLAAKAATSTIPIAFGVGEDPVRLGLVASLAQPGGNATGINFFSAEVASKLLGLLHELVPKAVRIAVLVNPANATNAESTLRDALEAAATLGLQVQTLKAGNVSEINAAFVELVRERAEALFVGPDAFLASRRIHGRRISAAKPSPS